MTCRFSLNLADLLIVCDPVNNSLIKARFAPIIQPEWLQYFSHCNRLVQNYLNVLKVASRFDAWFDQSGLSTVEYMPALFSLKPQGWTAFPRRITKVEETDETFLCRISSSSKTLVKTVTKFFFFLVFVPELSLSDEYWILGQRGEPMLQLRSVVLSNLDMPELGTLLEPLMRTSNRYSLV